MTATLKTIIEEVDKDINGKMILFGHHVDIFSELPEGYTLVFAEDDDEYPIQIAKDNFIPKYGYCV